MSEFAKSFFEEGNIKFRVDTKPVSMQNKNDVKKSFKKNLQKITTKSNYIIISECQISIDYYCQHIKRKKHPGAYDIDNIIKPILDALVGIDGIIIDDVIMQNVTVNWIDSPHENEHFEVEISHPVLTFVEKRNLIILKSNTNWCLPTNKELTELPEYLKLIKGQFKIWESISTEEEYQKNIYCLPSHDFIHFSKIRDRGYDIVDL